MSVQYALLGLLAQQPRHGYELHAQLQALAGGAENWRIKPAQVYTALVRLAAAGLVTQEAVEKSGGPEKRIFALTPKGLEALRAWLEGNVTVNESTADEVYLKLVLALMHDEALARRVLLSYRTALYRELHRLTTQRAECNPQKQLALILFLDKRIMHLEADLRWLDMVEGRLDEMAQQPLPRPPVRPRGRPPKSLPPTSRTGA